MSTILVDIDGVVGNFAKRALAEINRITGKNFELSDITQMDMAQACNLNADEHAEFAAALRKRGFCASIEPYENAIFVLDTLRRRHHNVVAVTTPLPQAPFWMFERWEWLRSFGFGENQIIFTADKSKIRGDSFIDDAPHHVIAWRAQQHNPVRCDDAFLFTRPWNANFRDRGNVQRVSTLEAFADDILQIRF